MQMACRFGQGLKPKARQLLTLVLRGVAFSKEKRELPEEKGKIKGSRCYPWRGAPTHGEVGGFTLVLGLLQEG